MTNYLETVTLKNHDLTGSLYTDAKTHTNDTITKKHVLIAEMMALSKMSSKKNTRNTDNSYINDANTIKMNGVTIVSGGIPIKDKENILRKKLRSKKSLSEKLISDFGEDYFINDLKIPKDKIYHFITYCEYRNINELYNLNKIIELIEIFTKESVEYLKIDE